MLIGVTNLFCDREAFEALERNVTPYLFKRCRPPCRIGMKSVSVRPTAVPAVSLQPGHFAYRADCLGGQSGQA